MHANDIAFGIEIETHMPAHDRTPIGGYRLGWTKGWYKGDLRDKRFGELTADEAGCDFRPVKKKLLDLARKYDTAI